MSKQISWNFSDWRFFPFATGVKNIGGAPWVANISVTDTLWDNQKLVGNWFMKKSCGTVPLICEYGRESLADLLWRKSALKLHLIHSRKLSIVELGLSHLGRTNEVSWTVLLLHSLDRRRYLYVARRVMDPGNKQVLKTARNISACVALKMLDSFRKLLLYLLSMRKHNF